METLEAISFWVVFSAGLAGAIIGSLYLADKAFREVLTYMKVYGNFIDFLWNKYRGKRNGKAGPRT